MSPVLDKAPTLIAGAYKDRPFVARENVAAVDCRNLRETVEISGTLQAKSTGSYSLNYQNPIRNGYIVRRLTPGECEALQGYPKDYTAFGHDGTPLSDTARYQALGNSVAIPCVAYVISGIVDEFSKENELDEGGR